MTALHPGPPCSQDRAAGQDILHKEEMKSPCVHSRPWPVQLAAALPVLAARVLKQSQVVAWSLPPKSL